MSKEEEDLTAFFETWVFPMKAEGEKAAAEVAKPAIATEVENFIMFGRI
jgi:hypothetical protein